MATKSKKQRSTKPVARVSVSRKKIDGLAQIARAIERIADCVERREERRDLVGMSLKEAAKDAGIKVNGKSLALPRTRVFIAPHQQS